MGITHPQDETTAADPQDAGAGATHATAIHATAEKCIAYPQVGTITTTFQAAGAVAPCVTTLMGNTCLQVDAITTAPQAAGTVSPCVTAMMGMARAATSLMAMTAVAPPTMKTVSATTPPHLDMSTMAPPTTKSA